MSRKKGPRDARGAKIAAVILMCIAVGALLYYNKEDQIIPFTFDVQPKKIQLEYTQEAVKFDPISKIGFGVYKNSYFQSTKDGIKFFDTTGAEKWNETYTMNSPTMIVEGPIAAVGELKGRMMYVFHEKGLLYKVQSEYPITHFAVNKMGYVSVILQSKEGYMVRVYNESGKNSFELMYIEPQKYPIATDVSDDGKMLVVSSVDVSGTKMISDVVFFRMDQAGKGYVDNMVSTRRVENTIIPYLGYMADHQLIALGDHSILAFDAVGNEFWNKILQNKVQQVFLQGKDYLAIGYGDDLPNGDGELAQTVAIYGLKGEKLGEFFVGKDITHLCANGHNIVVGAQRSFFGINLQGRVQWEYTATQDIKQMLPFEDRKRVLSVAKDSMQIMQVIK